MGMLVYNGRTTLRIDDRVLAHLQVVVIDKLRRLESFTFTWNDGLHESVCWIAPSIPLEFVFSGNRRPQLNRDWLELMAMSAHANTGLIVMPEPAKVTRIDGVRWTKEPLEPSAPVRTATRPSREPIRA